MATYAQLTTNERDRFHEHAITLHHKLRRLNLRWKDAITPEERTALRSAAVPILAELNAWTADSVAGTIPD